MQIYTALAYKTKAQSDEKKNTKKHKKKHTHASILRFIFQCASPMPNTRVRNVQRFTFFNISGSFSLVCVCVCVCVFKKKTKRETKTRKPRATRRRRRRRRGLLPNQKKKPTKQKKSDVAAPVRNGITARKSVSYRNSPIDQ